MSGIYRSTQYNNILAILPNPLTRVDLPDWPGPDADKPPTTDRRKAETDRGDPNRSEPPSPEQPPQSG